MMEDGLIHIRRLDSGAPLHREASALCHRPGADTAGLLPRLGVRGGSKDEWSVCICALLGPDPVGVLFLDRVGNCVQVRRVAITPRIDSRGTAEQLVYFAEQVALSKGVGRISLEALASARYFYERLGYGILDRHRAQGTEIFLMEKDLLEGLQVMFPPRA